MAKPYYWKAKKAWYVNVTLPNGRPSKKKLHANEEQALKIWAKMDEESKLDRTSPTFESISLQWLAAQELRLDRGDVSKGWVARVAGSIERFNKLHPVRCSDMTHEFLDEFASGLGNTYANTWITVLMQVLKWAKLKKKIKEDPSEGYKRPSANSRHRIIKTSEHNSLCRHANRSLKMLLRLMWLTGARPGEITSIKWDMLSDDLSMAVLKKHKTARKSQKPRVIYFSDRAIALIRILKEESTSQYVLTNNRNMKWTPAATDSAMRRLREDTGLDVILYDYRHTWITRALRSKVPAATVATLSGHSDVAMISRVYGHLDQHSDYLSEAAKKVR